MPKKPGKFPEAIRKPIKLPDVPDYHSALSKNLDTPEEFVALLAGNLNRIPAEKLAAAEAEMATSLHNNASDELTQRLEKILLLRDFYGIDKHLPAGVWAVELCMKLCDDLIPGFGVDDRSPGRPKTRTDIDQLKFVRDIEVLKQQHQCNDGEALRSYFIEQNKSRPSESEIRNLRTRLSAARNPEKSPLIKLATKIGKQTNIDALNKLIEILDTR